MIPASLRFSTSVLAALASCAVVSAEPASEADELSAGLDAFIQSAVSDGLLKPKQSIELGPETLESETAPIETPTLAPVAQPASTPCGALEILNFDDFSTMDTYEDLLGFRLALTSELGNKRELDSNSDLLAADDLELRTAPASILLARAYLAAGLNSEARMILHGVEDEAVKPLVQMSHLLDGVGFTDLSALSQLSQCADNSLIWHSVILLLNGDAAGVEVLRTQFGAFRKLPLQMRVNVAALAVPALERLEEHTLAERMLAEFPAEIISKTSRLRFSEAVIQSKTGDADALTTLRTFTDTPSAQASVLERVAARGGAPTLVYGNIPLPQAVNFVKDATTERDKAVRVRLLIEKLSDAGRYEDIKQLGTFPHLNSPEMTALIKAEFSQKVAANLASENVSSRLQAIDMVLNDDGFLTGHAGGQEIVVKALAVAEAGGYRTLSLQLSQHVLKNQNAAVHQDMIRAYRAGAYTDVLSLAETADLSSELSLVAAKAAIQLGQAELVAAYTARLVPDADRLVQVLEADALVGRWLVPDDAYTHAQTLPDPDHIRRVARIERLRAAQSRAASPVAGQSFSDALASLNASNPGYASRPGET